MIYYTVIFCIVSCYITLYYMRSEDAERLAGYQVPPALIVEAWRRDAAPATFICSVLQC